MTEVSNLGTRPNLGISLALDSKSPIVGKQYHEYVIYLHWLASDIYTRMTVLAELHYLARFLSRLG